MVCARSGDRQETPRLQGAKQYCITRHVCKELRGPLGGRGPGVDGSPRAAPRRLPFFPAASFAPLPPLGQPHFLPGRDASAGTRPRQTGRRGTAGRLLGPLGTRDRFLLGLGSGNCRTHCGVRTGRLRPRCCAGSPRGSPKRSAAYTAAPLSPSMAVGHRDCHAVLSSRGGGAASRPHWRCSVFLHGSCRYPPTGSRGAGRTVTPARPS